MLFWRETLPVCARLDLQIPEDYRSRSSAQIAKEKPVIFKPLGSVFLNRSTAHQSSYHRRFGIWTIRIVPIQLFGGPAANAANVGRKRKNVTAASLYRKRPSTQTHDRCIEPRQMGCQMH